MAWNDVRVDGQTLYDHEWNDVITEIGNRTSSNHNHSTSYSPITGSTVYLTGTSTQFVTGTSTQFTPANYNKTVVLYAGNSMIATTTYATLGQALTTANTINFIYGQFTTVAGERMQWGVQMDQGWNSSNLYATFNWTAPLSSQTGNVVWELSAIRIGDNTTMHNAVASVITSTDAFQGSSTAQVFHRSAETTNFLITGAGNYITFDLTRKIASDTLTTEAQILNIELRGTYASTY